MPLFKNILIEYLNNHIDEILKEMVKILEKKRASMKEIKIKQLERELEEVKKW